jgi:hypothetical protein
MQWEFLGKQELLASHNPDRGYFYSAAMWRAQVPGGWLLMTLNLKSSDPNPMISFYPDAEHVWKGGDPPEADYLLRPAMGAGSTSPEQLLRAVDVEDSGTKKLKS